ncbi:hypothetical protein DV515_00010030 [Chloebia gouldiae]|uniref:Uncharacterized protein n=1 Tax=Chloebia gouldiae TaxID=44316 RepID=A0A3L8SB71_CHLGU|nr:hypothetical protein DV515_00010030 [Chloebia gouldiae]
MGWMAISLLPAFGSFIASQKELDYSRLAHAVVKMEAEASEAWAGGASRVMEPVMEPRHLHRATAKPLT